MKRLLPALVLLLAVPFGASAQDTLRLTLDSCLRYAQEHNIQVARARLGSETAQASLDGARLRFLPSVSASASHGYSWADQTTRSSQVGVSGSLTLFSGLSNLRNLQQSRLAADQSELQVQQTANSIYAQIISAYLTILMNKERLAYQQEVLATSRQQESEGELKFRVGRLLESDYMLLQANRLSAESEIANTRLTIEDNRLTLLKLMGLDCHATVDVVASADTLKADDLRVSMPLEADVYSRARQAMPDWQISELNVAMARYNVQSAASAFLPTVSLNAGTAYSDGTIVSDNPVTSLGGGLNTSLTLGVSLPLLNRGASLTQLKQSKLALREAELQHNQDLIDLEEEVEEAYLSLCQALNRFAASEGLAEAYHASYEVYVVKYGEGAVTTVEMLQQQERYLSALNDYLQNKYSFILARKQLDIYMGEL